MTPSRSKMFVGAFVLTGALLLILGLLLLGGRHFFSFDTEYVLYFDGSVSGLSIGAPVVLRGVPMGSVTRIMLVPEDSGAVVTIPVYIQIDSKRLARGDGTQVSEDMERAIIQRMVGNGMQARLQMQSLITGQYRIEMDFFPGVQQKFYSSTRELEIPTQPSSMEALQRALNKLPLERVMTSLDVIMANLAVAMGDGKLHEGIAAFADTFAQASAVLRNTEMRQTLASMMERISGAAEVVSAQTPEAIVAFRDAMRAAADAAGQMQRAAVAVQNILGKDSSSMTDMRRLIQESAAAARALREFASMLERNPEALLQGRKGKY